MRICTREVDPMVYKMSWKIQGVPLSLVSVVSASKCGRCGPHYDNFFSQFTPVVVHRTIPCGHISRGLDHLIGQGNTVILPVFEGSLELMVHNDNDAYVGLVTKTVRKTP